MSVFGERMKRGRFPFFRVMTALSLALAVTTVMTWAVSFYFAYGVTYERLDSAGRFRSTWWIGADGSEISVAIYWENPPQQPGNPGLRVFRDGRHFRRPILLPIGDWRLNSTRMLNNSYGFLSVAIGFWEVLLATMILPVIWSIRVLRTPHSIQGLCRKCGYDLRATPERCPECGWAIGAAERRD